MNNKYNIALLGGRGYVGQEIIAILNNHPNFILSKVFSKNAAGESIKEYTKLSNLEYSYLDEPEMIDLSDIDIAIMALPNNKSKVLFKPYYDFFLIVSGLTNVNRFISRIELSYITGGFVLRVLWINITSL